jgi:TPR repeat protein
MGNFYAQGRSVTNDLAQAARWWQKAAAQNYANAAAALGELYLFSSREHGTNYINYPEGIRLLRLAAAQGSTAAMNNLGVAYETGTGVKMDLQKYVRWYRQAAERGEALAQANLGECYFDGRGGVPHDPVEAYKWIKLSSVQGCFLGTKDMSLFSEAPLKPKELAEAEQRVLDFHPRTDTNFPVEFELTPVTNSGTVSP